jgi:hypothetical protein
LDSIEFPPSSWPGKLGNNSGGGETFHFILITTSKSASAEAPEQIFGPSSTLFDYNRPYWTAKVYLSVLITRSCLRVDFGGHKINISSQKRMHRKQIYILLYVQVGFLTVNCSVRYPSSSHNLLSDTL